MVLEGVHDDIIFGLKVVKNVLYTACLDQTIVSWNLQVIDNRYIYLHIFMNIHSFKWILADDDISSHVVIWFIND